MKSILPSNFWKNPKCFVMQDTRYLPACRHPQTHPKTCIPKEFPWRLSMCPPGVPRHSQGVTLLKTNGKNDALEDELPNSANRLWRNFGVQPLSFRGGLFLFKQGIIFVVPSRSRWCLYIFFVCIYSTVNVQKPILEYDKNRWKWMSTKWKTS